MLGAGTMGARIAAHLANAGIPCYLLDIVPPELNADEKRKGLTLESPAVRNRIVLAGLEAAKKSRPAAFFTPETARLITPGNLEDNLAWCGEVDWIIEAVAENLEIKRKLFERVEAVRKPGTIVTSNTSGLPIHMIAEGRSEDFQQHWAGTHFFNPPRYMKLVELIPGPKTLPTCWNRWRKFAICGWAKEWWSRRTRRILSPTAIGTFAILNVLRQMQALEMTVEEVDACTGPAIGWPKSATFRTADIVGLDVLVHVIRNIYENVPNDESREMYRVPAGRGNDEARLAGRKNRQRILQASEEGRRIGNSDARLAEDGISPAAESEIRLDRSRESGSKIRASACACWWLRRWRERAATRRIDFCGLLERNVPVRRAPRSGNRR